MEGLFVSFQPSTLGRKVTTSTQYCAPMFLDSLTSTLPANTTSGNILTSASPLDSSSTRVSSSGRNETAVLSSSSSGSNIPDIISLD
ncbi:hypothetical protein E2320_017880 [Naja naja]|nr:hypothetical protein E2320_017880 [Naja naja]